MSAHVGQHFEAAAREAQLPLHGLPRVGDARDADHLWPPARPEQLRAQELGQLVLHGDLGLEVEPRREAEVLVRGPRVAVDAAVLAAAVRVDADVEADVGTVVVGERRARGVAQELRARVGRKLVREPLVGVRRERRALEAVRGCGLRAPAAERLPVAGHVGTLYEIIAKVEPRERSC